MKSQIKKEEALDFFSKNKDIGFSAYDQKEYFIKQLYKFGAKKVYIVNEYFRGIKSCSKNDLDIDFVDTLYVVVDKNVPVDLLVYIAGVARPDEVSYMKQHKAIRLWWNKCI